MEKEDEDIDMVRSALLIAMHRNTELDIEHYAARVESMAEELEAFLPPPDERYPLRMIAAVSKYLYEEMKFQGNKEDYYDPDNSCLDKVLDQRVGIPISISLVYMELAKRVGFPMIGVNMPLHFMIRPLNGEVEVLVDPFDNGKVLFVEDAEQLLGDHYGQDAKLKIDRSFFQDNNIHPRTFFTRMLTNLKQIYFNAKDYENALLITEYQQAASPNEEVANFNRRDRGILLYLMQRYREATEELELYLQMSPEAPDGERVRMIISSMAMPKEGDTFFTGGEEAADKDKDNEKKDDTSGDDK